MQYLSSLVPVFAFAFASAACGGESPAPKTSDEPAQFAEQAVHGADVYAARCGKCHGDAGEGSATAPAVVGAGALPLEPPTGAQHRTARFVTVLDVMNFVTKSMPGDAPGSLSTEEYLDVLAFDLKANGIDLGDQRLDAALAASLTIPRD